MTLKKGRTTSEFAVSVGAGLLGIALAVGVISMDEVNSMVKSAGAVSGSLIAACSALGYNISRGLAKKNHV